MLFGVITTFPFANYAFAQYNSTDDCASRIEQEMKAQDSAIDRTRAISLAENSPEFQSHVSGLTYDFSSVFSEGSGDPSTCSNYRINNVNVVFIAKNLTSGSSRNVVVTEDPALTKVMSVTEQDPVYFGGSVYTEGGEPLTQDQKDYCAENNIDPCTNNNILAKEHINIGGPANGANGGTNYESVSQLQWLILGIGLVSVGIVVGVVIFVVKIKRLTRAEKA